MQDHTPRLARPHDLTPVDPRIAALEDHLARETRSSQALAARVKELETLCAVLGVVPELPADGEPRFLSLADITLPPNQEVVDALAAFNEGRTQAHILPTSGLLNAGPATWIDGEAPKVHTRDDGKIVVSFVSPCRQWAYEFGHTFAEAVTLREALTDATAEGRAFFKAEQARDSRKEAQ